MRKTLLSLVIAFLTVLAAVPPALAQTNTTAATAVKLMVGQIAPSTVVDPAATARWYAFAVRAGRSYCAEVVMAEFEDTDNGSNDPEATVYHADATTIIVFNGDTSTEPPGYFSSRICYIPTSAQSGGNYLRITSNSSTVSTSYRLRLVETTLFSNWFFVAGDYNAFTLLRNTTDTTISYTVNWRNGSGAIVATTSSGIAGNGSAVLNARSLAGALSAGSGTVEVAHNGSPGAIAASTTVLSGTTGLSFDAPFTSRPPW